MLLNSKSKKEFVSMYKHAKGFLYQPSNEPLTLDGVVYTNIHSASFDGTTRVVLQGSDESIFTVVQKRNGTYTFNERFGIFGIKRKTLEEAFEYVNRTMVKKTPNMNPRPYNARGNYSAAKCKNTGRVFQHTDGREITITGSVLDFCIEHKLNKGNVIKMLAGSCKYNTHGWSMRGYPLPNNPNEHGRYMGTVLIHDDGRTHVIDNSLYVVEKTLGIRVGYLSALMRGLKKHVGGWRVKENDL